MYYVYLLRSTAFPDQTYIGHTSDLKKRLAAHNSGKSPHTSRYRPWHVQTYLAFSDEVSAIAFEKYLKSGSGQAFAKRRLWPAPNL